MKPQEHLAESLAASLNPADEHDRALTANVRPPDWVNPKPARFYNLVVIGAGTAGLVSAAAAAGLGAKVALIESDLMGGDCLNFGCVPSKAVIRSSRVAAEIHGGSRFGISADGDIQVDFAMVMERMRRLRAHLSRNDSAERFRRLGVDIFIGHAAFADSSRVTVDGKILHFKRAIIASGSRPTVPPIPGLAEAGYLTNETVFSLTEMPRRFAVIGGGPMGCELAQALARLGARTMIIEAGPRILPGADADAAALVARQLEREGIRILTNTKVSAVLNHESGKLVRIALTNIDEDIAVDEILVAAGRSPNVRGLNLEAAGVKSDPINGIAVDDHLRTSNRRIYAAGDVCARYRFTHMADAMARIAIRNALFFGRARLSALTVPSCVFTDPEVAHTGISEIDVAARNARFTTLIQELKDVDRAVLDSQSAGFVKMHVYSRSGRIAGATIVASHAGEIISEITLAIKTGTKLANLANVIHPYPTQAEAIRKIADSWNRRRLTPALKTILTGWMTLRRLSRLGIPSARI